MIVQRHSKDEEYEALLWDGKNTDSLKRLIESSNRTSVFQTHVHMGTASYVCFEIVYIGGSIATVYVPLNGYLVREPSGWICGYDSQYFEANFDIKDVPRTRYTFVASMGGYKTCHEIVGNGTLREAYHQVAQDAIEDLFSCPTKDADELTIKLLRVSEEDTPWISLPQITV